MTSEAGESIGSGSATPSMPATGSSAPVTGGASGGTVTGRYSESSDGSETGDAGVPGVTVGLYPFAFLPGTNALEGSRAAGGTPVATAMTGRDGQFRFEDVPPGRWFLVATGQASTTAGVWVQVSDLAGVAVDLTGCSTCPPPQ